MILNKKTTNMEESLIVAVLRFDRSILSRDIGITSASGNDSKNECVAYLKGKPSLKIRSTKLSLFAMRKI